MTFVGWVWGEGTLGYFLKLRTHIDLKWRRASGLKVNEYNTKICLFYRTTPPTITLNIGNQIVTSKESMNVLGVIFDATLKWSQQVETTLKKANSASFAIKMIAKFFSNKELNDIITACYYSILYYNADIWLIPALSPKLKLMFGYNPRIKIPNAGRNSGGRWIKKLETI